MAAVAVLAAGAGYFVARLVSPPDVPGRTSAPPAVGQPPGNGVAPDLVGQRRPDFRLADVAGRPVSADAFDGRILLVNFWATWCAPCVEEMPMLSQFQRDYAASKVSVVGIAVDEPERARQFAQELAVDYPLLFGLPEAMLVGRSYGNHSGMLPYSVLIDVHGTVRWTRLGTLERDQLEAQLAALKQDG
jgi:thiol-disulfide isomerase/thioredoxin